MLKKIDKNYYVIILLSLLFIVLVVPAGYLFGSKTDWFPQHIMFPDYFRQLFYQTGDLFPNFSLALGAGQNIFNFSYYGLFNPVILLSYLFPFIEMTTYLIVANALLYCLTGIMIYKWMKRHFNKEISLIITILLLCASPLLFHFHRHFMFVSYMPVLIGALMGVENYFKKKKTSLLTFCTFLMVMMSYYYSIPGIVVLILYGIYLYIQKNSKITIKGFLKDGILFLLPILLGIGMASILLVPTAHTVLSGRGTGSSMSLSKLLFPKVQFDGILYNSYSIGLTAVALVSLLYGIAHSKRENKFLSICILILLLFPIFSYILNGFLYIRDKVWIPFLPLFGFMIGNFLKDVFLHQVKNKFYIIVLFCLLWFYILGYRTLWFYADALLTLFIFYLYNRNPKWKMILLILLYIPIGIMIGVNASDKMVSKELYESAISSQKEIQRVLKQEQDLVRTAHLKESLYNVNKVYGDGYYTDSLYSSIYNAEYKNFYANVFKNPLSYRNQLITSSNNNLLYQMFMGDAYIYSDYGMIGYQKLAKSIYQNKNVLPVGYATSHIISSADFEKLKYPFTVETLLKNVVVDSDSKDVISPKVSSYDLKYEIKKKKNLTINKKDEKYSIKADEKNALVLSLEEELHNKILLIDFKLGEEWNCSRGDTRIQINHTTNTLTCKQWIYKNNNRRFHYVISEENLKELKIKFAKGDYVLEDFHVYILDYADIQNIKEEVDPFIFDKKGTKGDLIKGKVDVQKDGYFVTSIPYDRAFEIYDNGKKIEYEKVNTAFIGFKINKGKHFITMEYKAPGLFLGKIGSIIGTAIFVIVFIVQSGKLKVLASRRKVHK